MEIINIITRCTRLSNLCKIKESIYNTEAFIIKWYVCFDTSIIKSIDSDILSMLYESGCIIKYFNGIKGDFGHQIINRCIDEINSGFIYILDDDNLIHENFYERIDYFISSENKLAFVFNQKIGCVDFTGLDVREARPENMKVQKIDMAQFILHRDLIGDTKMASMDYKADGIFIENLYNEKPNDFFFIDEILCYYNFFQKKSSTNSLPRILVVGLDESIELQSNYISDYESTELNTLTIKDDTNIDRVIQDYNPDSIVTIGDTFENFPNLLNKSLDIRSRWIHFSEFENIGDPSYLCATNWMMSDHDEKTPLISFFTPVYNTGDVLWRTYHSLKDQDYTNWEWVVVNDSSDGGLTLQIAEEISNIDCRVKVYDFKKKSGGIVGESKYRAASLCRGKYLMELDHDDALTNDAGRLMVDAFQKYPDCKFVYSDCVEIDENHNSLTYADGFSFGYGQYRDELYRGRIYKVANTSNINPFSIRHIVGVPNHFRAWDRVFYHSIGGHNRRLTIADDYELVVRSFLKTKFVCIRKLLYLQFYHNSNTQNITRKDIQRRVRSISNYYNKKINDRFIELGVNDYAYDENPNNPLLSIPRYGEQENKVNYLYYPESSILYNWDYTNNSSYQI
jgi:glycosyltransferase involved in cell wall biosynthesis